MDTSETSPDSYQWLNRFALAGVIFLLMIYLVRNIDRYDLSAEFRYSELVEIVKPIQESVEAAMLSGRFDDITLLDSGEASLPNEVFASEQTHGISIIDGRIIATWMRDDSELDAVTYIVTPRVVDGRIKCLITGTCRRKRRVRSTQVGLTNN